MAMRLGYRKAGMTLALMVMATAASDAIAAESASGAYILGIRGPDAGVTPPPGVYFSNQVLFYKGDIVGGLPIDGFSLRGRAKVSALAEIPTFLLVTPVEIAGGRLGFSVTTPLARYSVKGFAGPQYLTDAITTFADPSFGAFLGWRFGDVHVQTGATAFALIGDYREGRLSNAAKHRGALDLYAALTWIEPTLGLDVTNTVGVTFNRRNEITDYRTGTEFHWDWSITRKFENGFSIGPNGYYYRQLSGDSGTGAKLGAFKGEVWAVGVGIGYDFKIGQAPVTARLRWFHEVRAERWLKGDVVFLGLSFPLWVSGQ